MAVQQKISKATSNGITSQESTLNSGDDSKVEMKTWLDENIGRDLVIVGDLITYAVPQSIDPLILSPPWIFHELDMDAAFSEMLRGSRHSTPYIPRTSRYGTVALSGAIMTKYPHCSLGQHNQTLIHVLGRIISMVQDREMSINQLRLNNSNLCQGAKRELDGCRRNFKAARKENEERYQKSLKAEKQRRVGMTEAKDAALAKRNATIVELKISCSEAESKKKDLEAQIRNLELGKFEMEIRIATVNSEVERRKDVEIGLFNDNASLKTKVSRLERLLGVSKKEKQEAIQAEISKAQSHKCPSLPKTKPTKKTRTQAIQTEDISTEAVTSTSTNDAFAQQMKLAQWGFDLKDIVILVLVLIIFFLYIAYFL